MIFFGGKIVVNFCANAEVYLILLGINEISSFFIFLIIAKYILMINHNHVYIFMCIGI